MLAYRRLCIAVFVLAFLGAACKEGTPALSKGTPTPNRSPTLAVPSASPPSLAPTPSASPILAEGRSYGYIKSVDLNGSSLVFDLVYLVLLGAAGLAVAATRLERMLLK